MSFDSKVDEPATNNEINHWWSWYAVKLIGFSVGGHEGPDGVAHWLAVTENQAGHIEVYLLCGVLNDSLPWARIPDAVITCMTCLMRTTRERWKEPT